MQYGEIWFVNFGDTGVGHEYRNTRPALIIEANEKIHICKMITLIAFSSKINNRISDDIFVTKNLTNGLFKDSLIKVQHITSFDTKRFINKIGVLDEENLGKVKKYL